MTRRVPFTLAAVLMLVLGLAQPAQAEKAGGYAKNASTSAKWFTITHNWCSNPSRPCGSYATLFPGQASSEFWADTDGLMIPSGCSGWVNSAVLYTGGRWYKITDIVHVTIHVSCP